MNEMLHCQVIYKRLLCFLNRYLTTSNTVTWWGIALAGVWIGAAVVSLLPWAGWNSWELHDARCHLSTLWPLSFTSFLFFFVGVHVALALLMWASSRATQLKAAAIAARTASTQSNDAEVAPIAPSRLVKSFVMEQFQQRCSRLY